MRTLLVVAVLLAAAPLLAARSRNSPTTPGSIQTGPLPGSVQPGPLPGAFVGGVPPFAQPEPLAPPAQSSTTVVNISTAGVTVSTLPAPGPVIFLPAEMR